MSDSWVMNNCMHRHVRRWHRIFAALALLAILLAALLGLPVVSLTSDAQSGLAAGLLGLLLVLVLLAWWQLMLPIHSLQDWAAKLRAGNPGARILQSRAAFCTPLIHDLNCLAEEYQKLSSDLHGEVARQLSQLNEKNRALELMYDIAASLHVAENLVVLLQSFLKSIEIHLHASAAAVRLFDRSGKTLQLSAALGFAPSTDVNATLAVLDTGYLPALRNNEIQNCRVVQERLSEVGIYLQSPSPLSLVSVPISIHSKVVGVFSMFLEAEQADFVLNNCELLYTAGRHLGIAVKKASLEEESLRLSRMEERAQLANELHDSLAQTLASLGLQVRVLDETLQQGNQLVTWQQMERVENSLDEAHHEIRELMAYFRAPADQGAIVAAVERLVGRFRHESQIKIYFQNQWQKVALQASRQVQVIHIIRESLNNIRKHSQAGFVRVWLRHEGDDLLSVLIEDDGEGFDQPRLNDHPGEHIGLSIMQERAQRLGGSLQIDSDEGEGVRVLLTFSAGVVTDD